MYLGTSVVSFSYVACARQAAGPGLGRPLAQALAQQAATWAPGRGARPGARLQTHLVEEDLVVDLLLELALGPLLQGRGDTQPQERGCSLRRAWPPSGRRRCGMRSTRPAPPAPSSCPCWSWRPRGPWPPSTSAPSEPAEDGQQEMGMVRAPRELVAMQRAESSSTAAHHDENRKEDELLRSGRS